MADLPSALVNISQTYPKPPQSINLIPIVIIGGGTIAQWAHIPTYIQCKYPIAAVCDVDPQQLSKCRQLLANYGHPSYQSPIQYFTSLQSLLEFVANPSSHLKRVIFDVATRPLAYSKILSALPPRSIVLLQKPFGHNLAASKELATIISRKQFVFGVTFTFRYAALGLFIKRALETKETRCLFGGISDVELTMKHVMPFHQWPWVHQYGPHFELTLHSVHYLDTLQWIFGVPLRVFAEIGKAPYQMTVILVYGEHHAKYPNLRIRLYIDHSCEFQEQQAVLNVNGTKGAMMGTFSSMLNETAGWSNDVKDTLKVKLEGMEQAVPIKLENSWMYQAFYGPISNIQRFANGVDEKMVTDLESCYNTQLLLHALKLSHTNGAFVSMKDIHDKHGIASFVRSKL